MTDDNVVSIDAYRSGPPEAAEPEPADVEWPATAEPTDGVTLRSLDGAVRHLPDPGPVEPYLFWTGEVTPEVVAFLRRGGGPWYRSPRGNLTISQGTDEDEDDLVVPPGEWITWLGDGQGFEVGQVIPIFMRAGWDGPERRVGHVLHPGDVPGLLRHMADTWEPYEPQAAAEGGS